MIVASQAAPPLTYLWNPKILEKTKQRVLAGDPEFKPAMQQLIADAKVYLSVSPLSVTFSNVTPPYGNEHDYVSFGTYWWPCNWDPTNITKGCDKQPGLPWIRRDGHFSPYMDPRGNKAAWYKLVEVLSVLPIAYYFTNDEQYATKASEMIKVWFLNPDTYMTPNLNHAQAHPGTNTGSGAGVIDFRGIVDPSIDVEDVGNAVNLAGGVLNGVALLQGSPSWTTADEISLRHWFSSYLEWLLTSDSGKSENVAKNNHGTWYDTQTAGVALFTSNTTVSRAVLEQIGQRRISTQIEPNGTLPEELARTTSFHYSWFALVALLDTADMAASQNIDVWNFTTSDHRSLKTCVDWLTPYVIGEKPWPYEQINPFDRGVFFEVYRRASIAWNDPSYEAIISKLPKEDYASNRINLLWPRIF